MSTAKSLLNAAHDAAVFRRRVLVLAHHLASQIAPGAQVLDVGSGDGSIARAIMALRPDVSIEGIDVAIRPTSHIPVSLFDGKNIPMPGAAFDCVMFVDVLHHTPDPAVLIREAARVSRASVLIKDHFLEGFAAGPTLRLMDWVGNRGHDVTLPYNYLPRATWTRLFAETGLTIEHSIEDLKLYPAPFTWLFDRKLQVIYRLAKRN